MIQIHFKTFEAEGTLESAVWATLQPQLWNQVQFGYADHDPHVAREANLKMVQALANAPPRAVGGGSVEKREDMYWAALRVHSPFRSFDAQAIAWDERSAVRKAFERLEDEFYRWRLRAADTR